MLKSRAACKWAGSKDTRLNFIDNKRRLQSAYRVAVPITTLGYQKSAFELDNFNVIASSKHAATRKNEDVSKSKGTDVWTHPRPTRQQQQAADGKSVASKATSGAVMSKKQRGMSANHYSSNRSRKFNMMNGNQKSGAALSHAKSGLIMSQCYQSNAGGAGGSVSSTTGFGVPKMMVGQGTVTPNEMRIGDV